MISSRQVNAVAGALLILSMAGSVLFLRRADAARPAATLQDVLYMPSPKAIKMLSLGFNGLVADIYWTRAVQYFGGKRHAGSNEYGLLAPLLGITTSLDPKLLVAYEYGSNFLAAAPPLGVGEPENALKLIEFGIQNNPDRWHLYYDLGFVYYLDLRNYKAAAKAFEDGSKCTNAHPFMKLMAGNMAQHAGDYEMAGMLWTATYESTTDKIIRANALAHLRAIRVDRDVLTLSDMVARYKHTTDHLPHSFGDLISAGLLRGIPYDPLRHPYNLMPDGTIQVRDPDSLPFISKGIPLSYIPPKSVKLLPAD